MKFALNFLRKLGLAPNPKTAEDSQHAFDLRLQKMGGVRRVSVARAVLFRTRPGPREA